MRLVKIENVAVTTMLEIRVADCASPTGTAQRLADGNWILHR